MLQAIVQPIDKAISIIETPKLQDGEDTFVSVMPPKKLIPLKQNVKNQLTPMNVRIVLFLSLCMLSLLVCILSSPLNSNPGHSRHYKWSV